MLCCMRGGSDWILGKVSSQKEWWGVGRRGGNALAKAAQGGGGVTVYWLSSKDGGLRPRPFMHSHCWTHKKTP